MYGATIKQSNWKASYLHILYIIINETTDNKEEPYDLNPNTLEVDIYQMRIKQNPLRRVFSRGTQGDDNDNYR